VRLSFAVGGLALRASRRASESAPKASSFAFARTWTWFFLLESVAFPWLSEVVAGTPIIPKTDRSWRPSRSSARRGDLTPPASPTVSVSKTPKESTAGEDKKGSRTTVVADLRAWWKSARNRLTPGRSDASSDRAAPQTEPRATLGAPPVACSPRVRAGDARTPRVPAPRARARFISDARSAPPLSPRASVSEVGRNQSYSRSEPQEARTELGRRPRVTGRGLLVPSS